MFETEEELGPDPVIEFYKKKIDQAAIRENLKLTVTQRLDKLIRPQRIAEEQNCALKQNDGETEGD